MKKIKLVMILWVGLAFAAIPSFGQDAPHASATPVMSEPIPLWPAGAPNEPKDLPPEKSEVGNGVERVSHVTAPTIQCYAPAKTNQNGTCVIIAPGGGYGVLAIDHEGKQVAKWLNELGITAVILKYRVPRRADREKHAAPLEDAQRAIRMVRSKAGEWGINPKRIGMLGFSAGGHLTAVTGTTFDKPVGPTDPKWDAISCRPDFLVLVYAAYMLDAEGAIVPEITISKDTPPTFLVVTHDDKDRGRAAALFYAECQKHGVPSEVHIYLKGGHGYGMFDRGRPVNGWPALTRDWFAESGLLESDAATKE